MMLCYALKLIGILFVTNPISSSNNITVPIFVMCTYKTFADFSNNFYSQNWYNYYINQMFVYCMMEDLGNDGGCIEIPIFWFAYFLLQCQQWDLTILRFTYVEIFLFRYIKMWMFKYISFFMWLSLITTFCFPIHSLFEIFFFFIYIYRVHHMLSWVLHSLVWKLEIQFMGFLLILKGENEEILPSLHKTFLLLVKRKYLPRKSLSYVYSFCTFRWTWKLTTEHVVNLLNRLNRILCFIDAFFSYCFHNCSHSTNFHTKTL